MRTSGDLRGSLKAPVPFPLGSNLQLLEMIRSLRFTERQELYRASEGIPACISYFTTIHCIHCRTLFLLSIYPECSTISVTSFPSIILDFICSGNGLSTKSPSSPVGTEMLMLLDLLVTISTTSIQSFERYTWPESVVSIWMVGMEPMIWTSKEGDEVIEKEDTAVSRTTDVFLHPAASYQLYAYVLRALTILTHGYSVDFTGDLNHRVDATKDVNSVVKFSVVDFNRFVVLLVFLL